MILPLLCGLLSLSNSPTLSGSVEEAPILSWQKFGTRTLNRSGFAARLSGNAPKVWKFLVVPMAFDGHPATFSTEILAKTFMGTGSPVTAQQFIWEQSNGLLDLDVRVLPWQHSTLNRDSCGEGIASWVKSSSQLMREAVGLARQMGVNTSEYDNDGDQVIDGLVLILSGKPWVETRLATDPSTARVNVSGDDQIRFPDVRSFLQLSESYIGAPLPSGLVIHELMHMLGASDLYDINGAVQGGNSGLGYWDIMASGNWGLEWASLPGKNGPWRPVGLGAFARSELGWVTPKDVDSTQELRLAPGEVARVWTDPYRVRQYLLLENRLRTGVDSILPGPGLLVTRIRPDHLLHAPGQLPKGINNDSADMGVTLMEASGQQRLAQGVSKVPLREDLYGWGVTGLSDQGAVSLQLPDGSPSQAWLKNIKLQPNGDITLQASPSPSAGYGLVTTKAGLTSSVFGTISPSLVVPMGIEASGKIVAIQLVVPAGSGTICAQIWNTWADTGMGAALASVCDSGRSLPGLHSSWYSLAQPIAVQAGQVIYLGQKISVGRMFARSKNDTSFGSSWQFDPGQRARMVEFRPMVGVLVQTQSSVVGIQVASRPSGLVLGAIGGQLRLVGATAGERVSFSLRDIGGRSLWSGTVVCDGAGAARLGIPTLGSGLLLVEAKGRFGVHRQVLTRP